MTGFAVPRPDTPREYDRRRFEETSQAFERELSAKHDKRADLVMDPGKRLVLSDETGGIQYALGIIGGKLSLRAYSDFVQTDAVVDWVDVDGAAEFQIRIDQLEAQFDDGDLSTYAKVTYVDTAISGEASSRALAIQVVETAYLAADAILAGRLTTAEGSIVTNADAISGAQGAIASLATTVSSNFTSASGRIANVEDDVTALDGRLTTAESSVTTNASAISDAENAIATLTSTVSSNFTSLSGRIDDADDDISALTTRVTTAESDITTNASAISSAQGSIASLSTTVSSNFLTLSGEINGVEADVSELDTRLTTAESAITTNASAITDEASARASAITTLTASVNTRARTFLQASPPTAPATGDLWIDPDDNNILHRWSGSAWVAVDDPRIATTAATVSTQAEAIATVEGNLEARYAIAIDAGGSGAFFSLEDGTKLTSAITLSADEIGLSADAISFGDNTFFDDASNTFITEQNGVRSRFGSVFGASSNLIHWYGPTSVAQGSESLTNGYLVIGTSGQIHYNTAALNWGATAAEVDARTSLGISAAFIGQGALAIANKASPSQVSGAVGSDLWPDPTFVDPANAGGGWTLVTSAATEYGNTALRSPNTINTGRYMSHARRPFGRGERYLLSIVVTGTQTVYVGLRFYDSSGAMITSWSGHSGWESTWYGGGLAYPIGNRPNTGTMKWERLIGPGGMVAPIGAAQVELVLFANCNGSLAPVNMLFQECRIQRVPLIGLGVERNNTLVPPSGLVTSEGISAGFIGQGLLAAGNYYEQDADPGAVANGSIWFKTGSNELFIRRSGSWGKVADITPSPGANDKAVSKSGSGGTATTSGTTWIEVLALTMTVGASGNLKFPTHGLVANPTLTLSAGTSFVGGWRITEATQADPTTKTVIASGQFSLVDTGGGLFDLTITSGTVPGLVAAANSGACRYTLEINRASGTNNVTGGGVGGFFAVEWTPQG